jgi:peptidyl-prolyl cis-trans isomerase D
MITVMRRYRRSLQIGLLVVIAAFVATSVFVFGSNSLRGGDDDNAVAKVNGEPISVERYQRRYQEYLNAYAATLRDRFTPEMAERMGLPQQVMDDLVQEELVMQRARVERLEVNDEELNAQIHTIPHFHEGGRFSMKRYEDLLRRGNLSKTVFEDDIRRRMTRVKVEGIVRSGVKLTDGEVTQAFVQNREEARATWALVDLAPIVAATTVTDAELEAYLKDHAAEFRLPERRQIQYVTFVPKDYMRPPTDAEVEKYYTEHIKEFETPQQVKAAHILARVGDTGGSEAEDKARAKIVDAIRRAKAGEDFGKLAAELSDDPGTKTSGGELGMVGKGEMVPDFEAALFALKKGEITSQPVRTPFGFHAIKATELREATRTPLKEAAPQIREKLQAEVADQAAKAKAEEARVKLVGAPDFMAQARSLGLNPIETALPRRDRPRGMAAMAGPEPVEETAFSLAKGGISTPLKTPVGYLVLKTVDELPATVPPLAAIKDRVTASLKRQKAEAVALERANAIVSESKTGDFGAAAQKASATVGETARFSRAKPADKLPGDVMVAALEAPAGATTAPIKTAQGYYVVKVRERFAPDMTELGTERDKLSKEVLSKRQGQAWQDWLTVARAGAKIETNASRLPTPRG